MFRGGNLHTSAREYTGGILHCVHFLKEPPGRVGVYRAHMHPLWLHDGPPFVMLRVCIRCADHILHSENKVHGHVPLAYLATIGAVTAHEFDWISEHRMVTRPYCRCVS